MRSLIDAVFAIQMWKFFTEIHKIFLDAFFVCRHFIVYLKWLHKQCQVKLLIKTIVNNNIEALFPNFSFLFRFKKRQVFLLVCNFPCTCKTYSKSLKKRKRMYESMIVKLNIVQVEYPLDESLKCRKIKKRTSEPIFAAISKIWFKKHTT